MGEQSAEPGVEAQSAERGVEAQSAGFRAPAAAAQPIRQGELEVLAAAPQGAADP